MLALQVDTVKKLAVVIVIGLVVAAFVFAVVVKNIVGKIISVVLLVGLSLGAWTQRNHVDQCVKKLQAAATTTGISAQSCTFFGVAVKTPKITVPSSTPASTTTKAG